MNQTVTLTIYEGDQCHEMQVERGSNLRQVLLAAALSPYARLTQRANCGGRGLCATCGVWIGDAPQPTHWHDWLAERFRYPRLSCQISVDAEMTVHLIPEKWVWGRRRGT